MPDNHLNRAARTSSPENPKDLPVKPRDLLFRPRDLPGRPRYLPGRPRDLCVSMLYKVNLASVDHLKAVP